MCWCSDAQLIEFDQSMYIYIYTCPYKLSVYQNSEFCALSQQGKAGLAWMDAHYFGEAHDFNARPEHMYTSQLNNGRCLLTDGMRGKSVLQILSLNRCRD